MMRAEHDMGSRTTCYGPKKAQLYKLFPSKKTQTITEDVVQHLLAGMEKCTQEWHEKVDQIASGAPSDNPKAKCMKFCPTKEEVLSMAGSDETTNITVDTGVGETVSSSQITPDASLSSTAGPFADQQTDSNVGVGNSSPVVSPPHRGGRWTDAELKYALHLIELFRARWIPIKDGTSMREFLSTMLRCQPQRISDKFKGNTHGAVIGEEALFVRDAAAANAMGPDTIETEYSKLRRMEQGLTGFENSQLIFGEADTGPIMSIINDQTETSEILRRIENDHQLCSSSTVSSDLSLGGVGRRMKRDAAIKRLPLMAFVLASRYEKASGLPSASTVDPTTEQNAVINPIGFSPTIDSDIEMISVSASVVHGNTVQQEYPGSNNTLDSSPTSSDSVPNSLHPIVSPTASDETTMSTSLLHDDVSQEEEMHLVDIIYDYDQLKDVVDNLDWGLRPRPSRDGQALVEVHNKKQADEALRYEIMILTREVLLHNSDLDKSDKSVKQEVEKYVTRLLFYDRGYEKVKYITGRWEERLMEAFRSGQNDTPIESQYKGRISLTDQLERKYPGKIRAIFRKAQKKIGDTATYEDLARAMNDIGEEEGLDGFHFNRDRVRRWFIDQGGKEKSPKPKPLLTPELKERRKKWALEMLQMLEDGAILVYIDEKWFWTTSYRRKRKVLPMIEGEDPDDILDAPRARSRRNMTKAMFMGAVANPCPEHGFDGKISLHRVASETEYKQVTYNSNFTDSAELNEQLKGQGWYDLVEEDMSLGELRTALAEKYYLDESISNRIVLRHQIRFLTDEGKKHKATFEIEDEDPVPSLEDLQAFHEYSLRVRYVKGDKRVVDINCDSKFMLEKMPEVGQAIRDNYDWVPWETPIHLVLDNAGGHGTEEAIAEYTRILEEDYNVICHHQCPRSPETNMLDLGVWMALQNVVERLHFRQRHEVNALCRTVDQAWEALDPVKLENVYRRFKK
eukprot:scaffold35421_cov266-Skeletonema_dohrnii-CCMP3373.AAC.1